jgi:hypothetical protein
MHGAQMNSVATGPTLETRRPSTTAKVGYALPALILLLGVIAALAIARADFTTHPTVELYTTEGIMPGVLVEEVNVRCSGLIGQPVQSRFMSDSGDTLFFNEASPTYPDASALCSDARGGRWQRVVAVGLVGVLVAGAVSTFQLVARRRRESDQASSTPSV